MALLGAKHCLSLENKTVKKKILALVELTLFVKLILATSLWGSCYQYLFNLHTRNLQLQEGKVWCSYTARVGSRARVPSEKGGELFRSAYLCKHCQALF